MKKKMSFVLLGLILVLPVLACSNNPMVPAPTATAYPTYTPLPTMTPVPTQTQLPTQTPLPTHTPYPTFTPIPTDTPVPTEALIEGVDTFLVVDGAKFKVLGLFLADKYVSMGETYSPNNTTADTFALLEVEMIGSTSVIESWLAQGLTGIYLRDDGNDRQDYWAIYDIENGKGTIVFVVDDDPGNLVLVFPGGEEIDLSSFLD